MGGGSSGSGAPCSTRSPTTSVRMRVTGPICATVTCADWSNALILLSFLPFITPIGNARADRPSTLADMRMGRTEGRRLYGASRTCPVAPGWFWLDERRCCLVECTDGSNVQRGQTCDWHTLLTCQMRLLVKMPDLSCAAGSAVLAGGGAGAPDLHGQQAALCPSRPPPGVCARWRACAGESGMSKCVCAHVHVKTLQR